MARRHAFSGKPFSEERLRRKKPASTPSTAGHAQEAAAGSADAEAASMAPEPAAGSQVIRRKAACACGGTCPKCRADPEGGILKASKVGPSDHPLEKAADREADRVMQGSGGNMEKTRGGAGRASGHAASLAPQAGSTGLSAGGAPLPQGARDYFEPRFGRDFSGVRLHQDASSHRLNDRLSARAFTYGNHVWLGRDAEAGPNRLLAHELAHVAQNQAGADSGAGGVIRRQDAGTSPAAPVDEPYSLHEHLETDNMSGREIEEEVLRIRAWLRQHASGASSEQAEILGQEAARLEAELERRQAVMVGVQGLANAQGDLSFLTGMNPSDLFLAGMIGGMVYEVKPRQLRRFAVDLLMPSLEMRAGATLGVVEGIGMDILANLEGLVTLLELSALFTDPTRIPLAIAEEALRLALDIGGHREMRMRQYRAGREFVEGLAEFAEAVRNNPRMIYTRSASLGHEVGLRAGQWFNDEFMTKSDFERGRSQGRIAGIILTEILLLFLGPEEWIARGLTATGQIARIATRATSGAARLTSRMIRIMEEVPGLRRMLTALDELAAAGRGAAEAPRLASGGTQAVESAGDVARGGRSLPEPAGPAQSGGGVSGSADAAGGATRTEVSETGPVRAVIENPDPATTPRRQGHLSLAPDDATPPPIEPTPQQGVLPVPEVREAEEVLDLAAGAEGMSSRTGDDLAPRASAGSGPGGGGPGGGNGPPGSAGGQGGQTGQTGGNVVPLRGRRGSSAPQGGTQAAGTPNPASTASGRVPIALRRQAEEIIGSNGAFRAPRGSHPNIPPALRRLEDLYQDYLRRNPSSTLTRAEWMSATRNREARAILNNILERNWAARRTARIRQAEREARRAARRAERVPNARRDITDPAPWRVIEEVERLYPQARGLELIPVRRDRSRPGIFEESMGIDQGPWSFEGLDRHGNPIQIDGFDDIGRMVENKSRQTGGHIEREMAELSFERRELAIQMRRQAEIAQEAGLPGLVWQTDNPDMADLLRAIAREEGLGNFVHIDDLSPYVPESPEIPIGRAIEDIPE